MGLSFAAHNLGEQVMDETLHAEIEDYISRRLRNPSSRPPATISVMGYEYVPGREAEDVPPVLVGLNPGKYQLTLNSVPYRVAVANSGNKRYVMLFNEVRQRRREEQFLMYLAVGVLIMTLVSAGIGWWLAGRIVAPVSELSKRVEMAKPEDETLDVEYGFPPDEIGKLARVFGGYLLRMRAFMERERAFTSDVSHELRTPLAVVQGAIELLEDDTHLNNRQQERIARIGRATRQMIDLTTALLMMARERNLNEPVEQDCDVWEVVRDAVEIHRYLINPKTTVEFDGRSHPRIEAERTLLSIVVANLIRNAFSYTESGKVLIMLAENCLTVVDTGPGIHEAEIGKVFQRHFKGSSSTGAGIGLSLVKRICDRYGWETVIESSTGQGTTARLFFVPRLQSLRPSS